MDIKHLFVGFIIGVVIGLIFYVATDDR